MSENTEGSFNPNNRISPKEMMREWQKDKYHDLVSHENYVQAWDFKREDLKHLYEKLISGYKLSHLRFYLGVSVPFSSPNWKPQDVKLLAVGVINGQNGARAEEFPGQDVDEMYIQSEETLIRNRFTTGNPDSNHLSNPRPKILEGGETEDTILKPRVAKDWIRGYIDNSSKRMEQKIRANEVPLLIKAWRYSINTFVDMLFKDDDVDKIRFFLSTKKRVDPQDGIEVLDKDLGSTTLVVSGVHENGRDLYDIRYEENIAGKLASLEKSLNNVMLINAQAPIDPTLEGGGDGDDNLYDFGSPCPPVCNP